MIPTIHFIGSRYGALVSPCGDSDDDAVVTSNPDSVTCEECLDELGKGK